MRYRLKWYKSYEVGIPARPYVLHQTMNRYMYHAYQTQQWQSNLNQLQDSLAPQVINEIGQTEYDHINSLTDLDEVVAQGIRLKRNHQYGKVQN